MGLYSNRQLFIVNNGPQAVIDTCQTSENFSNRKINVCSPDSGNFSLVSLKKVFGHFRIFKYLLS